MKLISDNQKVQDQIIKNLDFIILCLKQNVYVKMNFNFSTAPNLSEYYYHPHPKPWSYPK